MMGLHIISKARMDDTPKIRDQRERKPNGSNIA
jgi:hypothetical protein